MIVKTHLNKVFENDEDIFEEVFTGEEIIEKVFDDGDFISHFVIKCWILIKKKVYPIKSYLVIKCFEIFVMIKERSYPAMKTK